MPGTHKKAPKATCSAVVFIGDDYRHCQLAPGHTGQHVENIACDHPDGSGRRQNVTIKWTLDEGDAG